MLTPRNDLLYSSRVLQDDVPFPADSSFISGQTCIFNENGQVMKKIGGKLPFFENQTEFLLKMQVWP